MPVLELVQAFLILPWSTVVFNSVYHRDLVEPDDKRGKRTSEAILVRSAIGTGYRRPRETDVSVNGRAIADNDVLAAKRIAWSRTEEVGAVSTAIVGGIVGCEDDFLE